jgi:hypothetical protein
MIVKHGFLEPDRRANSGPVKTGRPAERGVAMTPGGKKRFNLNLVKIAFLAIFVCFLPNLRSCGNLSVGFPAVVYGSSAKVEPADFRLVNLAINIVSVGLSVLGLVFLYRRIRSDRGRRLVRSGFTFLGAYQVMLIFGYAVVYPLIINLGENTIVAAVCMIYAFFIHPYLEIVQEISYLFPDALHTSFLFGDHYDVPMRIGYVLMCGLWFGLGVLKARFFNGKKPGTESNSAGFPSGTEGYPVDLP